jgi:TPR repeat protein
MKKILLVLSALILVPQTALAATSESLQSRIVAAEHGDEKALSDLSNKAKKGDAESQVALGEIYYHGIRPKDAPFEMVELDFSHRVPGTRKDYDEAMQWFRKAADQGNAVAQERIGAMYRHGKGINQSDKDAIFWLQKSAEQGNADAEYTLGEMYWSGRIGNNFKLQQQEAMKWLLKAAEQENFAAQRLIGKTYLSGRGFDKDFSKAEAWLERSADHGDIEAMTALGGIYWSGKGGPADKAKAYAWYLQAKASGDQPPGYDLVMKNMTSQEISEGKSLAVIWQAKHASLNGNPALSETERYYGFDVATQLSPEIGSLRVSALKGDAGTFKKLQSMAESGNVEAELMLGGLYADLLTQYPIVWSVDTNLGEALKWFRMATDQGNAQAAYWYARIHELHVYEHQDTAEALKWYRKAADLHNPDAEFHIGLRYRDGQDVSRDYSEAAKWLTKAANEGQSLAQSELMEAYEHGSLGFKEDNEQAYFWQLVIAVKSDPGNANLPMDFVEQSLTPDQIALAWKQMREWKPIPYWTSKADSTPPR